MMLHEGKALTGNTTYGTPDYIVKLIEDAFGVIDIDVAADDENHVCPVWLNEIFRPWPAGFEQAYCNPPYGKRIFSFLERCAEAVINKEVQGVISLVPVRSDTKWFHRSLNFNCNTKLVLLKRKIKFKNMKNTAMFPSALFIYGKTKKENINGVSLNSFLLEA